MEEVQDQANRVSEAANNPPSFLGVFTHKSILISFGLELNVYGRVKKMKEVENLNDCEKLLSKNKHSSEAIKEILKWYDYSDKKGVASF